MLAIFKRDLAGYFNSVAAWVLAGAYLFLAGLIFTAMVKSFVDNSMMSGMQGMGRQPNVMEELVVPYMWWLGFLMMFILPMLTMRLLAEDRRTGTLELLFTYPVSELEIVLAKYFAAMTVIGTMLALSACSLLYVNTRVALEWNLVASGYAGLLLLASAFVAIGLWASSLSDSQLVAACVTYGMAMMLWLMQILEEFILWFKERLGHLGMMAHLENFARGNLTSHDIVYYLALTGLFLFLTIRVLDSRKWRM
jgi:ABC-2 type transport system permease protein